MKIFWGEPHKHTVLNKKTHTYNVFCYQKRKSESLEEKRKIM